MFQLVISGTGITNNSGITQHFVTTRGAPWGNYFEDKHCGQPNYFYEQRGVFGGAPVPAGISPIPRPRVTEPYQTLEQSLAQAAASSI
jgi:hypothetical protein